MEYPQKFNDWYMHLESKMTELEKDIDCECDVDYCCPAHESIQLKAMEYAYSKTK